MAGRASIVGAAATHVGKVREHNEDAHFFDADAGVFLVCDGMGGHAAGEVASALAIRAIRSGWSTIETQKLVDTWVDTGTFDAKKAMLGALREGVTRAHDQIIAEAERDESKSGMGTTLVGAMIVGNELVFAHAGDSRAYLVRDAIAMQLTEDHTLLARLLAAGIDVDVSGEGARFRSMLTNALGIGNEVKVSTFVVPLADGDRFLLCSDGISEYVKEAEIGEVLSKQPSPARAAQKLIDLALERGGADNATAIVVRVLEAGETPQPAEQVKKDLDVVTSCPLWGDKVSLQQKLRALRIAIPRDHAIGERVAANTLGDRVAWILVEGKVVQEGRVVEPGAILYPESLVADSQPPDRDGLAVARTDVRLLALRADDFRELCEDDNELGEALHEALAPLITARPKKVVRTARSDRADTEIDTEDQDLPTQPQDALAAVEPVVEARTTRLVRKAVESKPPPVSAGSIEEALTARVDLELDARFDAVFASDEPAKLPDPPAQASQPSPRSPLILKPRASEPKLPTIPKRPETDPGPKPSDSGRLPKLRPPTDPEIETLIELEAEAPPEEPSQDTTQPLRPFDDDDEPEIVVVAVETDNDARVVETVTETSSQTLVLTVTEPVEHDDEPEEPTKPERDDRIEESGLIVRPLSEPRLAASGTIPPRAPTVPPVEDSRPTRPSRPLPAVRPKRLSDGWDD